MEVLRLLIIDSLSAIGQGNNADAIGNLEDAEKLVTKMIGFKVATPAKKSTRKTSLRRLSSEDEHGPTSFEFD